MSASVGASRTRPVLRAMSASVGSRAEKTERGVVVSRDHGVGGQSVPARVASGDHAGGVDAGHGRKDGMVVLEEDALVGEPREVGHEVGANLGGLKAVEHDDED